MPKCINDSSKSYKGTEPSPKGLGYCAHVEEINTIKKDRNGNKWIINTTKNGVKRWIKYNNSDSSKIYCSKFVSYINNKNDFIRGLEINKGFIYKYINYNNFELTQTKIPKDFKKSKISEEFVKEHYCNEKKNSLIKNNIYIKKIKHPNTKKYFTHNNGGRPFLVYVGKNIFIYKHSNNFYIKQNDYSKKEIDNSWMYIQLVAKYKPINTFIGKSSGTKTSFFKSYIQLGDHSESDSKYFDGNTILLQLSKNKYIYIGDNIYTFTTNDKIIKYFSMVSNNDIALPIAIGEKYIFFLSEKKYININKFPSNLSNKEYEELGYLYYDDNLEKRYNLEFINVSNNIKNIKSIHHRL
jgi:hypothetical protein